MMEAATRLAAPVNEVAGSGSIAPATVIETDNKRLLLEVHGQRHWSVMALAYRYEAVPGDKVLVANDGETCYVIGVLEGRGNIAVVAPGNIEFRAPHGRIDMVASEGIEVRSNRVRVASSTLELVAEKAVQRFSSLDQWVRETLYTNAGRVLSRVTETYRLKAGKIVERAKGAVKIDGDQIKLG